MSALNIITTGHNAEGLSTFIDSPEYKVVNPQVGIIYSIDGDPINLNGNADLAAFASRDHSDRSNLFPKQGSVVSSVEWPPSSEIPMHRTLSVDVGVMVSGQIECRLDSGESRVLKQGDVFLQRGTNHAWVNSSSTEPARAVIFIQPSKPVEGPEGNLLVPSTEDINLVHLAAKD